MAGELDRKNDNTNSEERAKKYKGVTLMSIMYKIYVTVLAKKLREEVEEKKIIPYQTGFRKGMDMYNGQYICYKLFS